MIYNLQVHLNPRWRLIIDRDACAAFWKLNKLNKDVFRGFLSEKFSISLSVVIMKRSSGQFGDYFSGFGRQSEKFSRIGACIRRNFTPWRGMGGQCDGLGRLLAQRAMIMKF